MHKSEMRTCVHENFILVDNQFGNKKNRYRQKQAVSGSRYFPAYSCCNFIKPSNFRHVLTILAPPSYEECVFGAPVRPVKLPEHAQRGAEREEPEDNHFDDIDGYVPTYPFYPRYDLFL